MAKECSSFQGKLEQLIKEQINLELLFNTNDRDPMTKTSRFTISKPATIKKVRGTCGTIEPDCASHSNAEIIADYYLGVNQIYDGCECDVNAAVLAGDLKQTANDWSREIAMYAYDSAFPKWEDVTTIVTGVNARELITSATKELIKSQGFALSELIVVVNEDTYFDLLELEMACCDMNVQTSMVGTILGKKLGYKAIVYVPQEILGNDIKFAIYAPNLLPIKKYCETPLDLREKKAGDNRVVDMITQLGGEAYIGSDYVQQDAGVYVLNTPPVVV